MIAVGHCHGAAGIVTVPPDIVRVRPDIVTVPPEIVSLSPDIVMVRVDRAIGSRALWLD